MSQPKFGHKSRWCDMCGDYEAVYTCCDTLLGGDYTITVQVCDNCKAELSAQHHNAQFMRMNDDTTPDMFTNG
jgi:hypothetical protein